MQPKNIDINQNDIQKLKNISVAFNENEFVLIINSENIENGDGYLYSVPAEVMAEIVEGLYSSGVEYQRNCKKI